MCLWVLPGHAAAATEPEMPVPLGNTDKALGMKVGGRADKDSVSSEGTTAASGYQRGYLTLDILRPHALRATQAHRPGPIASLLAPILASG